MAVSIIDHNKYNVGLSKFIFIIAWFYKLNSFTKFKIARDSNNKAIALITRKVKPEEKLTFRPRPT
ncbi:hypothetical protein LS48_10830 [Aequorivita aquimaris]|uniref:Uncharacterized protein n=1 Tax=Aequorivita aquimaris TaxID=1548749 RepID=A0A137RGF8_9FLAO|nr:hypothetical protein LS48_10830 [Aequorivita aquimaris]